MSSSLLTRVVCAFSFLLGSSGFLYATDFATAPRRNVVRELSLSRAQKEEIRSITSSLSDECATQRRALALLQEDYDMAAVAPDNDAKEIQRLRKEMAETKEEIRRAAESKMKEIRSLLTSNQLQKLNSMRNEEHERLTALRESKKGDNPSDVQQRGRIGSIRSFSFMSGGEDSGTSWFSADEVFRYPERELWLSGDLLGDDLRMFDLNGEGMSGDFPSMQGLERMLESFGFDNGNGGPSNRFKFRFRSPNDPGSGYEEDAPGGSRNDDELMDGTPYTLPRRQPGSGAERNGSEKDHGDRSGWNKENMQKQMQELRKSLQQLEEQMKSQDE